MTESVAELNLVTDVVNVLNVADTAKRSVSSEIHKGVGQLCCHCQCDLQPRMLSAKMLDWNDIQLKFRELQLEKTSSEKYVSSCIKILDYCIWI